MKLALLLKGEKRWQLCIFAIEKNIAILHSCAVQCANTPQTESTRFIKDMSILLKSATTPGSRSQRRRTRMAEQWNDGWPKHPGWYRCLVDGDVEMNLKFYICQVARKPHWVDKNGDYIETQYKVKWKEN